MASPFELLSWHWGLAWGLLVPCSLLRMELLLCHYGGQGFTTSGTTCCPAFFLLQPLGNQNCAGAGNVEKSEIGTVVKELTTVWEKRV